MPSSTVTPAAARARWHRLRDRLWHGRLQRVPFVLRVGAFAIGLVLLSVAISTALAYRSNKQALASALGAELLAVAKTVSVQLNGDLLPLIQLGPNGAIEGRDEFDECRDQLLRAKQVNDLHSDGSPLYVLRPTPDFAASGLLEFVVMTDRNPAGRFFVGNLYQAEAHNRRALAGEAVATGIYTDSHGAWISACAPIRNRLGEVVAVLQVDRTVDFYFARARRQAGPLLLGALIGIVLAAIAAIPFASSLVRPVRVLAAATRRFAAGQLDHRVSLARRDELGALGESFNHMAAELQNAHHQSAQQQTALEHSLGEAQAAARAKDQFLATMSHEVRTPMNAIRGFNQLLRDTPLNEEQRECVETVALSADSLLVLLNDMLDFAKIESQTLSFEQVPFPLTETLERALKTIQLEAQTKGLTLTTSFDPHLPPRVVGDPDRLRQVLLNLLSNALKFTASGTILLQADLLARDGDDSVIAIAVTDTGIGIAPADQTRLFEPFAQVDGSSTRRFGGVGLGLAIARRLVELMQGELTVESQPRVGSTFRFTVRLGTAMGSWVSAPAVPAPSATAFPPAPTTTSSARPVAACHPGASPTRVLLVEDNLVNQKLAVRVLEKSGYTVDVAENGQLGVERHLATPYNLVLMDLQMPVMDGLTATRAIREHEHRHHLPPVPIVAVTANAMPGDDQRCYDAGMDYYLSKPFNAAKLAEAVRQLGTRAVT